MLFNDDDDNNKNGDDDDDGDNDDDNCGGDDNDNYRNENVYTLWNMLHFLNVSGGMFTANRFFSYEMNSFNDLPFHNNNANLTRREK